MKKFVKKIVILSGLLVIAILSCEEDNPTGYLAGSVMDSTYKPIANAHINVAGHKGVTNDEGQFFIESIPRGKHKLEVRYTTNVSNYNVDIVSDSIVMFDIRVDIGSATPNYYNSFGKKNQLISTNYDVLYATPSPDGKSLALEVFGGITFGSAIWQIGMSGKFIGILKDEGSYSVSDRNSSIPAYDGHIVYEGNPTWSPDGQKILYQTFVFYEGKRRDYHIWIMNLETGIHELIDRGFTPSISKDGKRVAYSKVISEPNGGLNWDIWECDLESQKRIRRLTSSHVKEQYPSWAYIGGKEFILYSVKHSKNYDIWKMEKDGSHPVPLTSIGAKQNTDALGPMASPNGKKIIFWSVDFGPEGTETNEKIWMMNIDGSNLKMVVEGGANPTWRKDSKAIYFVANRTWRYQVWYSELNLEIDGE